MLFRKVLNCGVKWGWGILKKRQDYLLQTVTNHPVSKVKLALETQKKETRLKGLEQGLTFHGQQGGSQDFNANQITPRWAPHTVLL
jgi:hypothetical protein